MNQIIKKEVTLGQLITVGFTLLTMILVSWSNMSNRVQALEINKQYRDYEMSKMNEKLDIIINDVGCIKIDLKGKADLKFRN